ncbi:MAG TPA: transglycosylase domain-containing protein [Dehalococcoidia bacterium]|nr:transglycosylase domain-containing protein [Dehalococcoidia bacterium]
MAKNGKNGNGNSSAAFRRRSRRHRAGRPNGSHVGGKKTSFLIKAAASIAVLGIIGFVVVMGAIVIVYRSYADDLVAPDELAINRPSYGAKILDRNGKLLYEYVDDQSGLRRPVKIETVSPAFLAATIATEDDSFFSNPGLNLKGLARAAVENSPLGGSVFEGSGGSSITQQLVKNVYIPAEDRQERWSSVGVSRKLKETIYALELTQRYDKEQILEWYINQISYGGVYNGVEAASEGYFGKPASELTIAEAALLAGIPQSPAAYDPVNHPEDAFARRNQILDILEKKGRVQIGEDTYYNVDPAEIAAARELPVEIAVKRFPIEAPHFVLQYLQPQLEALFTKDALYRDGLIVTTTLDLDLQHESLAIMERWIQEFEGISNSKNGSLMVMDPKTGEILVMIGSRDYFNDAIEGKNNNATACNSPGSSFKPFAYVTAFKELGWGPGTVILDTKVEFKDNNGKIFEPSNPSHDYSGPVTIRFALGNSLNIPADKAAAAVGPDKIVQQAKKMGFLKTFRLADGEDGCSAGGYGPAIATGGIGVTLEDMMIGYSVFSQEGVMVGQEPILPHRANERKVDPVSILKVTDNQGVTRWDIEKHRKNERVIEPEYPYLIWNVLSDASAQCKTFGCGGISIPGYRAGTKTGTSEPFDPQGPNAGKIGETWAFGYTPDLVVGIWAGNSDNSPIVNIYSTSISFRTMRDVFKAAAPRASELARPAGVVDGTICVPSGMKPTPLCGKQTTDLFVKDKLPKDDDTWWQNVRIDIRNNLLAGPSTPSQYVDQKVMLVFPPDLLKSEEDKKQAQEWAEALGVALAPTEVSNGGGVLPGGGGTTNSGDATVSIFSPTAGAKLTGMVQVIGRADSKDFSSYKLEYAASGSDSWTVIAERNSRINSGGLGTWNVDGVPNGIYVLRLTVKDAKKGDIVASVVVQVGLTTPGPTPTPPLQP